MWTPDPFSYFTSQEQIILNPATPKKTIIAHNHECSLFSNAEIVKCHLLSFVVTISSLLSYSVSFIRRVTCARASWSPPPTTRECPFFETTGPVTPSPHPLASESSGSAFLPDAPSPHLPRCVLCPCQNTFLFSPFTLLAPPRVHCPRV